MNEYENATIKQQRNYMTIMGVVILSLAGILASVAKNWQGIAWVVNLALTGVLLWLLNKKKKVHVTQIANYVADEVYKDKGEVLELKDYWVEMMGDIAYFYFPENYKGIGYDVRKEAIVSVLPISLKKWIDMSVEHDILRGFFAQQMAENKLDQIKEDAGLVRKDE